MISLTELLDEKDAEIARLQAELDKLRDERDAWEAIAIDHPAHPQLVKLLIDLMSDISEDAYCASWMSKCEYGIWEAIHTNGHYGMTVIARDEAMRLRVISRLIGGWVQWEWGNSDDPVFVPMDEWQRMSELWNGAATP